MIRKLSVFILILLFGATVVFAQSSKIKEQRGQKTDMGQILNNVSFNLDYQNAKLSTRFKKAPEVGDTLMFTTYDYFANNTIRTMIDIYDLDQDGLMNPVITAILRSTGRRSQELFFGDPSGYLKQIAFDTGATGTITYGFGMVQIPKEGPLQGKTLVTAHGGGFSWFATWDYQNPPVKATKSFGANYPAFHYGSNGSIWATAGDFYMYKSIDNGTNFVKTDSMSRYQTNLGGNSEIEVIGSKNGQYVAIPSSWTLNGSVPVVSEDSAHYAGLIYSADAGATWTGSKIGFSGKVGQVINRPAFMPLFDNFGQLKSLMTENGVAHVLFNGYGTHIISDSLEYVVIPVLYWNSSDKKWISVSDQSVDEDTNYNSTYRPGNGIGQAYPSISSNADGSVLFILYQTLEYKGTPGKSEINLYPGDGGAATAPIYYTDIYGTWSTNGGKNWSKPFPVVNQANIAECFPSLAPTLEIDAVNPQKFTAHFVYMYDKIPGTSLFAAQNGMSNNPVIYKTVSFTTTGVEDGNEVIANNFELSQNFPNPFNPSTSINFTLAQKGLVMLKVYDIMGREVSTLVNEVKDKGAHKVTFDAGKFTSGVYVYTLTSGGFTSTKKMTLVK